MWSAAVDLEKHIAATWLRVGRTASLNVLKPDFRQAKENAGDCFTKQEAINDRAHLEDEKLHSGKAFISGISS